jgi:hypothetical protein
VLPERGFRCNRAIWRSPIICRSGLFANIRSYLSSHLNNPSLAAPYLMNIRCFGDRFRRIPARPCKSLPLAARCARGFADCRPFRGRTGMPGAQCTRSLVCALVVENAHEYSQRSHRKSPGIPARNGLRLIRTLPGDRAFLPPSLAEVAFHKLDASVEASGPHDFTVRFRAARQKHIRVHRIPPRVRDDREPPLKWDGTAAINEVIWVERKAKIFFTIGLDSPNHTKSSPLGADVFSAKSSIPRIVVIARSAATKQSILSLRCNGLLR